MGHPFVIGVTGGIACGKSTVMRRLADLGADTLDADAVYHDLIGPGSDLWEALRRRFGSAIIGVDGGIDRAALAGIVFADPDVLVDLDRITHPVVTAELRRRVATSDTPVVAVDAVKLIESGFDRDCDRVWVVTCERPQQIARLSKRNRLEPAEAARRVDAQSPIAPLLARADLVIDNSGEIEQTRAIVTTAWNHLFRPPPRATITGADRSTSAAKE